MNRVVSQKEFEVKDHLGNVRLVFSDLKDVNIGNITRDRYKLDVRAVNNYYPFGMLMPDMSWQTSGYRYGFGGHENDNDVKGVGNHSSFGDYGYDPRVARRYMLEPMIAKYPSLSPYVAFADNPIYYRDPDGLNYKKFQELNKHEKPIALFNPLDAMRIGENVKEAFMSSRKTNLDGRRDGRQDAFRHAYWNAINTRDVGHNPAKSFADAHETGASSFDNKSDDFDPVATKMDLWNNYKGRAIALANPNASNEQFSKLVRQALANGELKMIVTNTFSIQVGIDDSGNPIMELLDIAVDRNNNPIVPKSQSNLIRALTENGYEVNTDTSKKQLIQSNDPSIKKTTEKVAPDIENY